MPARARTSIEDADKARPPLRSDTALSGVDVLVELTSTHSRSSPSVLSPTDDHICVPAASECSAGGT